MLIGLLFISLLGVMDEITCLLSFEDTLNVAAKHTGVFVEKRQQATSISNQGKYPPSLVEIGERITGKKTSKYELESINHQGENDGKILTAEKFLSLNGFSDTYTLQILFNFHQWKKVLLTG
ncbi:hypothetical protein PGTUg99_019022 [Puccinia graminis f. sp. tritici]|uniref:Uncharacterized protein n=1 Tax=Puccinia graminis f. sp. tritici TaxID=56615 RepID=A0A5B0PKS0_PUCGR|nr:hypothetical protein PGTUg99_019022 [Puccinia graminis f. sp. tritici]